MKKNLFIAAMGLLVLAGCSSNEDEIDNIIANNDNAISFDTYVGKVTKAGTDINQPFGVFAYENTWNAGSSKPNFMFNQEVSALGVYSPAKYWTGNPISFIAYAPYKASQTPGSALKGYTNVTPGLPSMDFTLNANATEDLLVSNLVTASSGDVAFLLKHALSKVSFVAGTTGDTETTIDITTVVLTGMNQTGVLQFGENSCTWGSLSKTDEFSVEKGTSYLLIPQDLADLKAKITYTITTEDEALPGGVFTTSPKTVEIELTTSVTKWESAKQYIYTVTPKLDKIVLSADVDDWTAPVEPNIPQN